MNIKHLTLVLAATVLSFLGHAQLNMSQLGYLNYQTLHGTELSDVWGYVDTTGREYALVGAYSGFSIVDVSNPALPVEVFWQAGPNSTWRDIKTWDKHAYITNENTGGLLIVDMSSLPNALGITTTSYTTGGWSKAHNLFIDERGVCYIFGANRGNKGSIFLDLSNPKVPVEIGQFDNWYTHDGMARGDTLYQGNVNDGWFSIIDVSNKLSPVVLATQVTPNVFSHNIWVNDATSHVFTTDEVSGAFIGSYDITNMSNISEEDRIQSSPGQGVIPHNTHVLGKHIITSYYRDGVVVHDIDDPTNLVEVGNFDTSPSLSGDGFNGCWGVYPWLPSTNILATDIELGLYVLGITYVEAARLEGQITDSGSGFAIAGATAEIVGQTSTNSNITGDYATGVATAGSYTVAFSKAGYYSDTAFSISLTAGAVTIQNMALVPRPTFAMTGTVIDSETGDSIPFANVIFQNLPTVYQTVADADGNFTLPAVLEDEYEVVAGSWGHITFCDLVQVVATSPTITIELDRGYYDDFSFDFLWTESGNAATGAFERGEPVGTTSGGDQSNPDVDVNGDCLDQAYITGNAGGGAGNDDVDNGNTVLTSPIFDLTDMVDPVVSYYRWFYNAGGSGAPNDDFSVSISNGDSTVLVMKIDVTATDQSQWVQQSFLVADYVVVSNNMRLIVETQDQLPGHLVEAGLDMFEVLGEYVVVTPPDNTSVQALTGQSLRVYPNPADNAIYIALESIKVGSVQTVHVMNITGAEVTNEVKTAGSSRMMIPLQNLDPGVYLVRLTTTDDIQHTARFVVNR